MDEPVNNSSEWPHATTQEADIVIVGAGLAGAIISYQLAQKGYQVICLEAGPEIQRHEVLQRFKEQPDRDFQTPYCNTQHAPFPSGKSNDAYLESVGENDYNVAYIRGVGGTTWHWAGHSWRFLEEDFKENSYFGVGRDMPVSYSDLEPYYYTAEVMMGVAGVSTPLDYYQVKRNAPYPLPPLPLSYLDSYVDHKIQSLGLRVKPAPSARNTRVYDQRPQCCGSNNCMPICPVGAQYSASVHIHKSLQFSSMKLIPNAVVNKISTTDHKSIDYISYLNPNGQEFKVKGRSYVLAAGGIEIPKLMLMSEIGNDNVGRNLMDHPLMFASFHAKDDVFPGRGPMVIGSITDYQSGDFRSKHAGFRINLKNFIDMQEIAKTYIGAGLTGKKLKDQIDQHARRVVAMEIFLGQQPHPENRVTLSPIRRDALGIPQPRVNYSVGAWTERAVKPAYQTCESIAKACGYLKGSFIYQSELAQTKRRFASNNHIMGTTVMGEDPKKSVTDSLGRVYSRRSNEPMSNLFIASSSLLGATGTNNVSLTIAALSLRLADHLHQALKH